jgi:hypothetical protein
MGVNNVRKKDCQMVFLLFFFYCFGADKHNRAISQIATPPLAIKRCQLCNQEIIFFFFSSN